VVFQRADDDRALQDGFHWANHNSIRSLDLETTVGHESAADSAMEMNREFRKLVNRTPQSVPVAVAGYEESPSEAPGVGQGAIDS